jgi:hypothetical protein
MAHQPADGDPPVVGHEQLERTGWVSIELMQRSGGSEAGDPGSVRRKRGDAQPLPPGVGRTADDEYAGHWFAQMADPDEPTDHVGGHAMFSSLAAGEDTVARGCELASGVPSGRCRHLPDHTRPAALSNWGSSASGCRDVTPLQ